MDNLERIPPHNLDAEEMLLGALLTDSDSFYKVSSIIKAESFYSNRNKTIYKAIVSLKNKDIVPDIVTVSDHIKDNRELEAIGGRAYINDLALSVCTSTQIEYHAKVINDKYILREFIKLGGILQSMGYENENRQGLVNFANNKLSEIINLSSNKDGKDLTSILCDRYKDIGDIYEDFKATDSLKLKGVIETNFKKFDKYMRGGFKKGELTVIAARSRIGKTAFQIAIQRSIALNNLNVAIADFQLETPEEELADRHLANMTGIKKGYFTYVNHLTSDMFDSLANTLVVSDEVCPIRVFQNTDFNIVEIEAKARQYFESLNKDGIIFIDNLQLVTDINKGKNDIELTTNITRDSKKLAQRLQVPVVLLAQLVKEAEDNSLPTLKDIRGSGQVIANSDKIILLHSDTEKNEGKDNILLDAIFAKVRGGQEGTVRMSFDKPTNRFQEILNDKA
jgi:replicative DNA helicase